MVEHTYDPNLQPEKLEDDDNPLDKDQDLQDIYNGYRGEILGNHDVTRRIHLYNFPTNNLSRGMSEFSNHLNDIHSNEHIAFRVNVSFVLLQTPGFLI